MHEVVWASSLGGGARHLVSSAIRDLLHVTEQPGMISFAGGLPAPECFPATALADAVARVLASSPAAALQYGPTEGYRPLRAWLVDRMADLDVPVAVEDVLITSGSQQGLDLVGKLFLDPDAPVIVEHPTYLGALQAWQPYRPRFITLPMDDDGLQLGALEQVLQSGIRPRFLYLVSSFQNPTGRTLSTARRRALIELAAAHRLLIVEDDPYGELYYDGTRAQLLAALDLALHGQLCHVLYLSTFSKLLAPGLRVGWMVGDPALIRQLVAAKQGLDLHTGSLAQATIADCCGRGLLAQHVPQLRATYRERRDVMLQALQTHMPQGTTWSLPHGGLFVWLTLLATIDAAALLPIAVEHEVVFVPGAAFFASDSQPNTLRLNFSHPNPERIEEGVRRLARAMGEAAVR